MTNHIAALIERWRTRAKEQRALALSSKDETYRLEHTKLAKLADWYADELEAARDADCADWSKRRANIGNKNHANAARSMTLARCIEDLGGKP